MKRHLPAILSAALLLGFIGYSLLKKNQTTIHDPVALHTSAVIDTVAVEPPTLLYGINVDDLQIIEGSIQRNQNLSEILSKFNVSYATIDQIARNFKDVFDVRKIAANKKYSVLCSDDSLMTARCFVYEPNPLEYIVFNLDSMDVYREFRKIDTVVQQKCGIIDYSLYNTIIDAGANAALAQQLSDVIFAWQIDFFRIQKGDRFKVIYEELQVEGKEVGMGKVIAAVFEHAGNPYYGIYFNQDGKDNYFDESGASLRKAFLKAPLSYSRISSRFTNRRLHPVLKIYRAHHGVDYAAPTGTPVYSVGDGVITKAAYEGGAGRYVKIRHNSVYTTGYMHLSRFAKGIKTGARVKQGDLIGYVGSTGLSTGPHLDFRYWMNDKPVNPLSVQSPPSEPIKDDYKDQYEKVKNQMIEQLNAILYPDDQSAPIAKSY